MNFFKPIYIRLIESKLCRLILLVAFACIGLWLGSSTIFDSIIRYFEYKEITDDDGNRIIQYLNIVIIGLPVFLLLWFFRTHDTRQQIEKSQQQIQQSELFNILENLASNDLLRVEIGVLSLIELSKTTKHFNKKIVLALMKRLEHFPLDKENIDHDIEFFSSITYARHILQWLIDHKNDELEALIKQLSIIKMDFSYQNLSNFNFTGINTIFTVAEELDFSNANLSEIKGVRIVLKNARLNYTKLQNANLQNADLQSTHWKHANLQDTDLQDANLQKADLQDAKLHNANLQNADLRNAHLHSADLQDANLHNADLQDAKLQYAKLKNTNLHNAKLQNANIRGAYLESAYLTNVDLTTTDLTEAYLYGAITNDKTIGIRGIWAIDKGSNKVIVNTNNDEYNANDNNNRGFITMVYGLGDKKETMERAAAFFDRAIEKEKDFAKPYYNKGYANFILGKVAESSDLFKYAKELEPDNRDFIPYAELRSILHKLKSQYYKILPNGKS